MIEVEKLWEGLNTTIETEETQEHREKKGNESTASLIDLIGDFLSEASKIFSIGQKVHKVNRDRYHSAVKGEARRPLTDKEKELIDSAYMYAFIDGWITHNKWSNINDK